MRTVILGSGSLALTTARLLIEHGHEVVLIEPSQEIAEKLAEELDCGIVVGEPSRPAVLKEIGPQNSDCLLCLADDDQDNIIAALVGRSLGFGRVVTSIKDPDFGPICAELGLSDAVFLDRSLALYLTDMVEGVERAELAAAVRGGLRFYSFRVPKERAGAASKLGLPEDTKVIAATRAGRSRVVQDDIELKEGDEILVVGDQRQADRLREIFAVAKSGPAGGPSKR